jgi:uncharacterized protein (DUF302 family)
MSSYGFSITLKGSMDQMVKKVTEALKTEGFGVLTEINVKDTLKAKLNVETRPYMILGACNPQLAHKALTAEPDIGLLLPCNVVVREQEDGTINVAFLDPDIMVKLVGKPEIQAVAKEARIRLERVRDSLKT